MARGSSGIVAGLTAAAVVAVGFLAYQASANAPDSVAVPKPEASSSAPAVGHDKPKDKERPTALPAESGTGARVVYALGDRRVWLVDAQEGDPDLRRHAECPEPTAGGLQGGFALGLDQGLGRRADRARGAVRDGRRGCARGFSAAQDGSMESPDPTLKTGGVRMKRADGDAMWAFATVGAKVVVVP